MRNVIARRDSSRPGDHVRRYRHRADRVIVWGRGRPGPRVLHSGRLAVTSCVPPPEAGRHASGEPHAF